MEMETKVCLDPNSHERPIRHKFLAQIRGEAKGHEVNSARGHEVNSARGQVRANCHVGN